MVQQPVWPLPKPVPYEDPKVAERNKKALAEWKQEVDSVAKELKLNPSDVCIFTVDGSNGKYNLSTVLKSIVDRLVALEAENEK